MRFTCDWPKVFVILGLWMVVLLGSGCSEESACDPGADDSCVCLDEKNEACSQGDDGCVCSVVIDDSNVATSNGTTATSNGTTGTSNGTTGASNQTSNGTTATSNGTTATSNGTAATSNGTTGTSNGTTGTSNGTIGGDPCDGVECLEGQLCEDGECVDDGSSGGWPEGVIVLDLDDEGRVESSHSMSEGAELPDLDWAHEQGCFPARDDEFWAGNYLMFGLSESVGAWKNIEITITPDPEVKVSLFTFTMDEAQFMAPPDIDGVGPCRVSFEASRVLGRGEPESITLKTHSADGRNVLFGVASSDPEGITVEVNVTDDSGLCYDHLESAGRWPGHVSQIELDEDGRAVFTGDLASGAPVCDLAYLEDQSCAPSTQFSFFEGNHVFYAMKEPIPPRSILSVTVTPDPGVEVSLYGSREGELGLYVPPNFLVRACDASLGVRSGARPLAPNPGESESISLWTTTNGFQYFFAVAGDAATGASGQYTVSIELITDDSNSCTIEDYEPLEAWPGSVTAITLDDDNRARLEGDLSDGEQLCTLDWASNSQVACFPATRFAYFEGNHVFYRLAEPIPPRSVLRFEVRPELDVDVNIYGWRIGLDDVMMPPRMTVVGQCDASYGSEIGYNPDPGQPEVLEFHNPSNNPLMYAFAVAGGAEGGDAGPYQIDVELSEGPPPHCPESLPGATYATWPGNVTRVPVDDAGIATVSGDLSEGSCMNLDWAKNSQVACFPETRFAYFEGNHVFYALDEPLPPRSTVTISVTPDPDVEISLYGYQIGDARHPVPPNVLGVVTCNESHALGVGHNPNPGETETLFFNNPSDEALYNIFFAVAGDALTGDAGAYTIDVDIDTAEIHCEESLPGQSYAAWPETVTRVALNGDNEASLVGDLADGACTNLDWAQRSNVACFPGTRFAYFEGNHVFYALDAPMPPQSVLNINVTPDPDVEISLYGLRVGADDYPVPPNIQQTISCNESHAIGVGHNPDPGQAESLYFENPTDNPYNIFFAVAGDSLTGLEGRYRVDVSLIEAGDPHCAESLPGRRWDAWPASVETIRVDDAGNATVSGDLNEGSCTNLDWAQRSDIACFPETRFAYFEGNHVFYALDEPLPPRSVLNISVTPDPDVEISLYGYQDGPGDYNVPPAVQGVVTCNESHALGVGHNPNPGETETLFFNNPSDEALYNIFFAVAGDALTGDAGAYTIDVDIDTAEIHCEESLPGQSYAAWPEDVEIITLDGQTGSASGNLAAGACTNLDWAQWSSVACFVEPRFDRYEGNHRFYTVDGPIPADTRVEVRVVPDAGVDVSVYAYLNGTGTYYVPPYVPQVTRCEAEHSAGAGAEEVLVINNPLDARNVLIGVAGAEGTLSGGYTVELRLSDL